METKKIIKFINSIVLVFMLMSCDEKINKKDDSNTQIVAEIKKQEDGCLEVKKSLNNNIINKGKICDSLKEGYWEEFYIDGAVKWKGNYLKGKRQYEKINFDTLDCNLTIKGNPESLKLNHSYPFRVEVPGIHPDDVGLTIDKAKFWVYENTDEYDFAFMPIQKDTLTMQLLIGNPKEGYPLCKIIFLVK